MRWRDIGDLTCSVARTLSVVGDRWTLLILRDAFLRTRRFEDFQTHLGMTRHRLADRLSKLVEHGIFERARYQDRPERFEYRLTDKGRDLYPVIVSLVGWGDRWMAGKAGAPIELVHRACGHVMTPAFTCPHCRAALSARDVTAQPGPALRALSRRNRQPARTHRAATQRSSR
ncbi:MAG: helix-turn-helix transcriptional regulator [Deltaproteobacteria bacterium]|nr:helix-turn-helix transcriptional regulator [Deltaproteobacteria bacterium]MBI3386805.1 helix-turn-helix transcriptional regulator [Deltaproteobacteria bacterium]